jgi:hypothetical protein
MKRIWIIGVVGISPGDESNCSTKKNGCAAAKLAD